MTASVPTVLLMGRVLFLFWRSTAHWVACVLAASLCLGSRMMLCLEGSVQQFSKRFILNLTLRILATFVLRSSREANFLLKRSSRLSTKVVETISISRPLLKDLLAASHSFSANPWLISQSTALQSETTSPSNFHQSLRTCLRVNSLAVLGSPLRSLKADIQLRQPLAHNSLKGGRQISRKVFSGISVVLQSRPPSVAPYPTQCFPQAATDVMSFKFLLWKPFTTAVPITDARQVSSPQPSAMRPQRGSLAISTIGVKVHLIPIEEASMAAILDPLSARAGLKEAACASGMGKTVLYPWMTSLPMMSGILRRDCSMAIFCIWLMLSNFHTLRKEPTPPSAICLMMAGESCSSPYETCCSWPIFSLRVMMDSNCLMAVSISSAFLMLPTIFSIVILSIRSLLKRYACCPDIVTPIKILSDEVDQLGQIYCRTNRKLYQRIPPAPQSTKTFLSGLTNRFKKEPSKQRKPPEKR